MTDERLITRRTYLVMKAMLDGQRNGLRITAGEALEAVSSTAIEHPEWDMDETKTWQNWEAWNFGEGP